MATRSHYLLRAPTVPGVGDWRWSTAAMVIAAAGGVAAARLPLVALGAAGVLVVLAIASFDLVRVERADTYVLVIGAMCLGYGWANLGIPGPVPIPITEILFIPLAGIALLDAPTRLPSKVLLPLILFVVLVVIRLVFDYPVWGRFAIRDTTMAIEALIMLVGYRAIVRDGVEFWVRRMRYIAGAVLAWGALHPFIPGLGAKGAVGEGEITLGPRVGANSAALLDPRGVKFSVIAAGLYFVVFGRGWVRVSALGALTTLLGIYQARTLYIMLPLGIFLLGWAAHRLGSLFFQIVPAVLIAALVVSWAASQGLRGGEGPVSTSFLKAHAGTLLGNEGPNSATIEARQSFTKQALELVMRSPGTFLAGVGLGPDLTFGEWTAKKGQLVRNPHDTYLEVFARTGALGFLVWIWLLLACLIPMARKARSGQGVNERFCAWTLAGSVVYLGVAGAQPLLAFPYGSVPLFFVLGMGVAAALSPRGGAHRPGVPLAAA